MFQTLPTVLSKYFFEYRGMPGAIGMMDILRTFLPVPLLFTAYSFLLGLITYGPYYLFMKFKKEIIFKYHED